MINEEGMGACGGAPEARPHHTKHTTAPTRRHTSCLHTFPHECTAAPQMPGGSPNSNTQLAQPHRPPNSASRSFWQRKH
eukprot:1149137-Pelagomonas_calceolata.AAC.1